jgi:hypothetical protein
MPRTAKVRSLLVKARTDCPRCAGPVWGQLGCTGEGSRTKQGQRSGRKEVLPKALSAFGARTRRGVACTVRRASRSSSGTARPSGPCSRSSTRRRRATRGSSSLGSLAQARACSRDAFMSRAHADSTCSWTSRAGPSRPICWKASSSGMNAAHLRGRSARSRDSSSSRTAAPCSWTSLRRWASRCRPSCSRSSTVDVGVPRVPDQNPALRPVWLIFDSSDEVAFELTRTCVVSSGREGEM